MSDTKDRQPHANQFREGYVEGAQESKEAAKEGMKGYGFGDVIPILKAGRKAARLAWKQANTGHIELREGVLAQVAGAGLVSVYSPSTLDVFAEDWVEVE